MPNTSVSERADLKRGAWAGLLWSVAFGLLGLSTTLPPAELLVSSAVGFVVVTLASMVGSRGLAALWALLLLLWFANLLDGLVTHGQVVEAGRYLPEQAAGWLLLSCPLLLSTAVMTRKGIEPKLWVALGASLTLFAPLAYLARFAVDVGGSPLRLDGLAWAVFLIVAPAPILLSGWVIGRLRNQNGWRGRVR